MLDNPQNRDFNYKRQGQLEIEKMGMKGIISRMPGQKEMVSEGEDPETALDRFTSIIDAMTEKSVGTQTLSIPTGVATSP